ncbi:MAG: cytochrome P450 [Rhodocyclales bacterium]|nr:cytochrome P450 [Rhodocyclales bacterium]
MVEDTAAMFSTFRPPAPQPPSSPVPLLHLLWAVFFNPLYVWHRLHFEDPVVVERTILGTRLVVSDPALIKWILVDNAKNYVRDSLQQRLLHRMTGRGVFSAEGSDWQFQRKLLAPYFSAKALVAYLPGMTAAAEDAVNRFRASSDDRFDLGSEMSTLTVDALGRTVFSGGLSERPAGIADSVRQFADTNGPVEVGDLLGLPPWIPGVRRLWGWRATAQVRQRARGMLAKARASELSPKIDFLSALISARDPETGETLGDRAIEDNVSTLIGAGSDTVAVALTWAIFLLSQAPRAREAVEAEVDANLKNGAPTADTLGKLVWTRAVIEEAMRLYPPAPMIGRMICNEDTLGGNRFPAGTTILISPWVLHRHTQLWSDPDMFEPERFLPGRRELIPRYAYLPFGAGPRVCLGMGFAMQEAVVVLATLIKHLRFERADDHPIRLRQCITLQTVAPLRMRIRPRQEL